MDLLAAWSPFSGSERDLGVDTAGEGCVKDVFTFYSTWFLSTLHTVRYTISFIGKSTVEHAKCVFGVGLVLTMPILQRLLEHRFASNTVEDHGQHSRPREPQNDNLNQPFTFSSRIPDDNYDHLNQPFTFSDRLPEGDGGIRRQDSEPLSPTAPTANSAVKRTRFSPQITTTQLDHQSTPSTSPKRATPVVSNTAAELEAFSERCQTRADSEKTKSPIRSKSQEAKTSISRHLSPWQHEMRRRKSTLAPTTVRQFDPQRQRRRLLINCLWNWSLTVVLCGALAACLAGFESLPFLTLLQKHAFNAVITMLSLLLGANLASSLREYAQILRWRLMTLKYRPLAEFDLLMQCESQKKTLELFWMARTPNQFWPNRTQLLCVLSVSFGLLLQVLVALLGLTYSLESSQSLETSYGKVSICDLSSIRDVWGEPNPSFYAQLGAANYFGIQGQDYNFVERPSKSLASVPTLNYGANYSTIAYNFRDRNIDNPPVAITTTRTISTFATCEQLPVVVGGYGNATNITYIDNQGLHVPLDVVRVGPGAVTYISNLNETCGPRCTTVFALQSASNMESPDYAFIPVPSFFKCNNTISPVHNITTYIQPHQHASLYSMADEQARIMAGAIGWSGFNFTPGDRLQYVRYPLDTWWSPPHTTSAFEIAERIMEFAIEGVAAMDFNGPRKIVAGWFPVASQAVRVDWRWAGTILGGVTFLQFLVLCCVVQWSNGAVIKDRGFLGIARLLRPVMDKLGEGGCLLTGDEIAEELGGKNYKVAYGFREPVGGEVEEADEDRAAEGDGVGATANAKADTGIRSGVVMVRHVDILEEDEGLGKQGYMPAGRYDGLYRDRDYMQPGESWRMRRRRGRKRSREEE